MIGDTKQNTERFEIQNSEGYYPAFKIYITASALHFMVRRWILKFYTILFYGKQKR